MNQKKSASLKRIILSSKYSYSGLKFAWYEGAFRLECYLFIILMLLCLVFKLALWKCIIIFTVWMILFITEVLNSAIEACIDRISFEKHQLSKAAKDLGSFAVFLAASLALIISFYMFLI